MSVHLEHCGDRNCGRLFEVEQFSQAFGTDHPAGFIECPYCRWRLAGDPSKVYLSRRLRPDLEDWNEK